MFSVYVPKHYLLPQWPPDIRTFLFYGSLSRVSCGKTELENIACPDISVFTLRLILSADISDKDFGSAAAYFFFELSRCEDSQKAFSMYSHQRSFVDSRLDAGMYDGLISQAL